MLRQVRVEGTGGAGGLGGERTGGKKDLQIYGACLEQYLYRATNRVVNIMYIVYRDILHSIISCILMIINCMLYIVG